ncbi:MAG: KH domain-containing protein, partial [Candidatus Desulfovibrio faecigallinarum]|nr:KH domain-containing protein [Candidatus Desulfovibrio faecigallinarum]
MKELLEEIARGLVDHPEQVRVEENAQRDSVLLTLSVARGDQGKLIGRQGRTVRALRTYLRAVSRKSGRRMTLEISE